MKRERRCILVFVKSRTHGAFSAARVLCCSTRCWRQLCRNGGRPAPWWNMHDVAEGSPAPAAVPFQEDGPGNKGLVSSLPAARPPTGGRANGPALEGRTADSGRDQHPSYRLPRAEKEPPVGSLRRVVESRKVGVSCHQAAGVALFRL